MERILIVEDNKTTANLIAQSINSQLYIDVDIAYRLSEAKLFLKMYKYSLTILDLVLPDAPNAEVVDYVLKRGHKVLVLSANIDKEIRKKLINKNIIDYINKSDSDVEQVISTIQRLQKNKAHKVLVVDDSMLFRKQMKDLLENLFFNVITVAHGEEALGMIQTHPDISLVITDYNMPVMDGLELTKTIRETKTKNDIHIIAISSNSDDEITALFLKNGANDYIKKPFSKEEFTCRVNNSIELLENIQLITNHANRDYLTGLYNRRYFFEHMQNYVQTHDNKFAIAMIDIDFFKKINDTYGHDIGDQVIIHLSEILRSNVGHKDLVSRFGKEEFCVVLKDVNLDIAINVFERIRSEIELSALEIDDETKINYTISIGLSMYNEDEGLDESINQADMMLYKAKNSGKNVIMFHS